MADSTDLRTGTSLVPSSRAGRRRDPDRDAAILAAFIELIVEHGYDLVTMEQVAAHAGVGKATIYRRWSSKGSLAIDALRTVKPPLEPIDTGSLHDDLVALAAANCQSGASTVPAIMRGIASAISRDADLLAAFQDRMITPRRERVEGILERARDRGELGDHVNVPFVAEVMPSMMLQRLLTTGQPATSDYIYDIVYSVLMPLLGVTHDSTGATGSTNP